MPIGEIYDNFPQYSSAIADASYAFDYNKRVTIPAGNTVSVTFPVTANVLRIRSITVEDVTAAVGGSAPALIACYYRIDGTVAGSGAAVDGSHSRIVKPGERQSINRFCPSEDGVSLYNPNAASITLQVELGG
jgi:hypothetical protein